MLLAPKGLHSLRAVDERDGGQNPSESGKESLEGLCWSYMRIKDTDGEENQQKRYRQMPGSESTKVY